MTPINVMARGKIVGHVEETSDVFMGYPSWKWTCYGRGSGCMPTKVLAVAKVLLTHKHARHAQLDERVRLRAREFRRR